MAAPMLSNEKLREIFPNLPAGLGRQESQNWLNANVPDWQKNPAFSPPNGPAPVNESDGAKAYLAATLREIDLESMTEWAWKQLLEGRSADEVLISLREQAEYKQRFAGLIGLRENGYPSMDEATQIAWERSARETMIAAGLPPGFYDSYTDFAPLISKGWSTNQLTTVVNEGILAVHNAPQEVRDVFADWFGPSTDQALAAFFIDPEKALPVLQRQVQMAQIGGSATRFGFDFSMEPAEKLARMGVDQGRADAGFQQLYDTRRLYDETVTESEDITIDKEGVDLMFDAGPSGEKARKRGEARKAATSGGGGATVSRGGGVGLGTGSGI